MTAKRFLILSLGLCVGVLPACDGNRTGGGIIGALDPPIEPACIAVRETEEREQVGLNDNPLVEGGINPEVIALTLGQAGHGSLHGGGIVIDGVGVENVAVLTDTDFWSIDLSEGDIVTVELFGTRLNQGGGADRPEHLQFGWDSNAAFWNEPRLTLWQSVVEGEVIVGLEKLLEHTPEQATIPSFERGWRAAGWGFHDTDIPCVRIPEDGTYFLSVTPEFQGEFQNDIFVPGAGAEYAVCVRSLPLLITQKELEEPNTDDNDNAGGAELLSPADGALVRGLHHDAEDSDFYKIEFTSPDPVIVCAAVKSYRNGVYRGSEDYFAPRLKLRDPNGSRINDDSTEDVFFDDPALCYKLDPGQFEGHAVLPNPELPIGPDNPLPYFLQIKTSNLRPSVGAAEYYLAVEVTPLSEAIAESEPNGGGATAEELLASADPIAYGQLALGQVDDPETDVDIWQFTGTAGDMVVLQIFDIGNSDVAEDCVQVALLGPGDGDVPGFVSADPNSGIGSVPRIQVVCFDKLQAIRTILQETGTYFVALASTNNFNVEGPTDYCFDLELIASAQYETEGDEGNNDVDTADTLNFLGRAAGTIKDPEPAVVVANDCVAVADVDVYQFTARENEVVTISAFADQASRGAWSDGFRGLSGHGSTLRPRLRIIRVIEVDENGGPPVEVEEELSHSTFTPTGNGTVTTESVTRGLATAAVTFVAPEAGVYFVEVSDERTRGNPGVVGCIDEVEVDTLYYVIERS